MNVLRNYLFNLSNILTNLIFPFLTFPFVSRVLGPDGLGQVQYIFSIIYFFNILSGLAIPTYGIAALAKTKTLHEKEQLVSQLVSLNFVASMFFLILYLITTAAMGLFSEAPMLVGIGATMISVNFFNTEWYFQGLQNFKSPAIRSFIVKILGIIFLFLAIPGDYNLESYLGFLVFLYVGNYLLNFITLIKSVRIRFSLKRSREHLKQSLFILSTMVSAMIYTTFDSILLADLADVREVGYYTAAVRLSKIFIPLLTALGLVLMPGIAESMVRDQSKVYKYLQQSFTFIAVVAIPISIGLFMLSNPLIILFSGDQFLPSIDLLIYLSWLPLIVGYGHFFSYQILVPSQRTKQMFISGLSGCIVFLISSFLLIPNFGAKGAGISTLITELTVTVMYILFVPKNLLQQLRWLTILESFAAGSVIVGITLACGQYFDQPILIIILSIVLSVPCYFVIQYFIFRNIWLIELINYFKSKFINK